MEATETIQMPVLGEAGEPCGECGAPLAADQRYCLECGRRRTGPRVDYRTYLAPSAAGQAPPPAQGPAADRPEPEAEAAKPERDFAPLAAVGGIALLGLMLLVGVLIGKGGGEAASPAPQVIRVAGGGETAATDSGAGDSEAKDPSSNSGGKAGKKGSGTGAKAVAGGLTGDAARQTKGTVQASQDDLEALENTSGEDYEDAVKKLPDKIATPGEPPPIDKSKAPGGGDGGVTIE